jgi:hypothetical protein
MLHASGRRKPWREAGRDALASGTGGALLSTAALAARGRAEAGSAVAPTNAISHWFWGDRAARQDAPSARYTLVGYVTHHIASIFWAVFYERWFGRAAERGDVPTAVAGGLGVAAVACFVDYRMTPRRLQPGYEARLGKPSLAVVYLCFGVGLALGALVNARARADRAT